jgi:sigma-54 dependent transcriptional regulator, acetoin dehydrogenase operon transcriptional activator AcoR
VIINVPPLAERRDDIPLLVHHFLDRAGGARVGVTSQAIARLYSHHWPGNVRELRQTVEWALALCGAELGEEAAEAALAHRAHLTVAVSADVFCVEGHALRQTLERHAWNTDTAARQLGVHRATLYRRMKPFRLTTPSSAVDLRADASLSVS